MAHLALARAHGHGSVAFERLDVVEAFPDALLEVLLGDVLAEADELLTTGDGDGEQSAVTRGGGRPVPRRAQVSGLRDPAGFPRQLRRGLASGPPPLQQNGGQLAPAGHLPGHEEARGKIRGNEQTEGWIETQPRPGLPQQTGRGLEAPRQADQLRAHRPRPAGDHTAFAVEADEPGALDVAVADGLADGGRGQHRHAGTPDFGQGGGLRQHGTSIGQGHHLDPGGQQVERHIRSAAFCCDHEGAGAGLDPIQGQQSLRRRGQHHARQVVPLKDQGMLEAACGDEDAPGPHP